MKIKVRKLSIGRIFVFPSILQPTPLGETGRPKSSQGQGLCISEFLFFYFVALDLLGTSLTREIIRGEIISMPSSSVKMSLALTANWQARCSLLLPVSWRSCCSPSPEGVLSPKRLRPLPTWPGEWLIRSHSSRQL